MNKENSTTVVGRLLRAAAGRFRPAEPNLHFIQGPKDVIAETTQSVEAQKTITVDDYLAAYHRGHHTVRNPISGFMANRSSIRGGNPRNGY